MLRHRKGSPRAFTVEVKASGRRVRPVIPSRGAEPEEAEPAAIWPMPPAETKAPAVEARRILPSLIEPEPPPEAPAYEIPRRPGRPRKVRAEGEAGARQTIKPIAAEPVAAATAPPPPMPTATAPKPACRTARPEKPLPAGERWKRRLPRWAR